jgi:hypothetical protein
MEIVCRDCESNAFRILPEEAGTVIAECVVCGTLTLIEVPRPSARTLPFAEKAPRDLRCLPVNGHRHESPLVMAANTKWQ